MQESTKIRGQWERKMGVTEGGELSGKKGCGGRGWVKGHVE